MQTKKRRKIKEKLIFLSTHKEKEIILNKAAVKLDNKISY